MTTVGVGVGVGCGQFGPVGVGGGCVPIQTHPNSVVEPLGLGPDSATS